MVDVEPLRGPPQAPNGHGVGPDPSFRSLGLAAAAAALAACEGDASPLPVAFRDPSGAEDAPGLLRLAAGVRRRPLAAAPRSWPVPDVTALLDWAEAVLPDLFPGRKPDLLSAPYVYRHYPETGNYAGVAGSDVYVLGPVSGGALKRVGSLADYAEQVHADVRPVDGADAAAARFLQQCQFSSTLEEIAAVRAEGVEAWLARQMSAPRGLTGVQWLDQRGVYDTSRKKQFTSFEPPAQWMGWNQILTAPDAVRTRAVLALSEFFVVSTLGVAGGYWPSYAMAAYWDTLSAHAFGNFRALLEAITLNYAMGVYLNTLDNQKEDASGRQPDENYAREVMQLFTIGLYELDVDGSLKLDAAGRPIETYGNADVTNLARVFTGYVGDDDGVDLPSDDPNHPLVSSRAQQVRPMRFDATRHSTLECRFLGTVIPAGTSGPVALRIALDRLFNHANVGPFFSRQMIQRLVVSNPSPAYVGRVAAVFADNGRGVRGDLRAVFTAIWLDPEARGAGSTEASRAGKLREFVLRVAQWGRSFASVASRSRWSLDLWFAMGPNWDLNQTLLRAPSVFNYFRPGYVPPLTQMATRGWVAPEFQLVQESSTASYLNWMQDTIRFGIDVNTTDEIWDLQGRVIAVPKVKVGAEYAGEQAYVPYAGALVARLNLVLCAGQLPGDVQRLMIDALNATPVDASSGADARLDRLAAAVLMVMAAPEYLVQH